MTNEQMRQALEIFLSWLRVFFAASLAVYGVSGELDLNTMVNAGLAAVIPVIIRWLDPTDKMYGRGSGN